MRPTFIVHVSGSRPYAVDLWTKPYKNQHTAAGQATRILTRRPAEGRDWKARIYRLGEEDYRGNGPKGPVLTFVQAIQ